MADTNNTVKTVVELNTSQAQLEIARLNGIASDTTKTLEERVAAKNKQVTLSNELSKKTIQALNTERQTLEGKGATEKELLAIKKKLDAANLRALKTSISTEKQQVKLTQALEDSKNPMKLLDDASGGLLTRFRALAANPLVLTLTILVGVFTTLKEAVSRSGKASETFGKIGAKLSGIMNGLLAVLEPVVEFIGDKLLFALENPMEALKEIGDAIKENLINRIESFLVLGEAFSLLMEGKFSEAAETGANALIQFGTGQTDAINKIKEFGAEAVKNYEAAAKSTEDLAGAEKQLARNRIALEKQQLISLRLAEEQRQIRDDEARDMPTRIAANKKLGEILEDQAKRELAIAQQTLGLARSQQSATGDTIENIEKVGDAEIKLLEIRERITGQRSEQLVNENSLIKEQTELNKAAQELAKKQSEEKKAKILEDAELAREKFELELEQQIGFDEIELERKKMNGENTLEIEKEILENEAAIRISQAQGNADAIELIEAQKKLALDQLKDSEEKSTKAKNDAELQSTIEGASAAFGISQEVATARMLMAAPEAIGNVWTQAAKQPTLPQVAIHGIGGTAMVVAPIVKGLSDIKKARFSKSKAPVSSGSISTSSAATSSNVSTDVISDLSSNNSARLGIDPSLSNISSATASNNVVGSSSSNIVFSEGQYSDFQDQIQFKETKTTI
ncbi:structural protein [Cellulophaga phage phi13:1]|uniref:Structural protein n=1 Tax=Cellulophaga phage phi13:1 TaxID=1327992 RepID=S0A2L7_9CAUD|nr:structural protein [Cellulophaga phage phi13:1]